MSYFPLILPFLLLRVYHGENNTKPEIDLEIYYFSIFKQSQYIILSYHINLLFRFQDAAGNIRKIADFIGTSITEGQLHRIMELSSFSSMRDTKVLQTCSRLNQDISQFMRKGKAGDWINYFTPEQSQYLDDLYKQKIVGSGLDFKFEV